MKKWIFASIFLCFLSSMVWANTNSDYSAAQNVMENWFAAMKNGQVAKAGSYLAPQFVSIHTDGLARNKTQEMDLIKNLHMKDYNLSHFQFSRSSNVIVVTFKDEGSEKIDNKPIAKEAAGRMAVLQKQGKNKWLIIAYANLDQIT